jgi:hypothetical protein
MPKRRDITDYYIQTLAQQVARKFPEVTDYACNVYADRVAHLDIVIDVLKREGVSESELQKVRDVRQYYVKIGTALWFMQSGELSNLGAKLGSKIVEEQWNPSQ